jgi:uncharacterized membrane protein
MTKISQGLALFFRFLKEKETILLLLCFLAGFGLRFYGLDQKSLWIDEIHTYSESRDGFAEQLDYYKRNPTHLQPPLFFVLTHLFYPFPAPERDLRIIPLIAASLSIPMLYFLSRSFSSRIALPCTIALTFMTYHIYLSQDARSYSLLLLVGMIGLHFFLRHLRTSKTRDLVLAALSYSALLYLSYSSVLFIVLSQFLWFLETDTKSQKPRFPGFLILNGLILVLCLPWLAFMGVHFTGQSLFERTDTQPLGSFASILYGVLSDWCINMPLLILSASALFVSLFLLSPRRNHLLFLLVLFLPPTALYASCILFKVDHYISSRYFVSFLPVFLISLFLSIDGIAQKLNPGGSSYHLKLLFTLFFVGSNLLFLPRYYTSQKQDFRSLVKNLESHLADRDTVFVASVAYIPGILHYLGIFPESRHYSIPFSETSANRPEFRISVASRHRLFSIVNSASCCSQYTGDGSRLWLIVGASTYEEIHRHSPCTLKGVFDGTVSYFRRFPSDASMYLLLCEPAAMGGGTPKGP